jgi:hypothetical protein
MVSMGKSRMFLWDMDSYMVVIVDMGRLRVIVTNIEGPRVTNLFSILDRNLLFMYVQIRRPIPSPVNTHGTLIH